MTIGQGDGMVPSGYDSMRTSQAERERAVDVLKAAFAEGRLDQDEYAERVGQIYSSRTYADLSALTADLPVGPLGLPGNGALPYPMPPPQQFMPPQQFGPPLPYPPPPQFGQPMPPLPAGQYLPQPGLPRYPQPWPAPTSPEAQTPSGHRRMSGLALAALIFGLGGFLTAGLTAPLAMILGGSALIETSQGHGRGRTFAIAGIVLGVLAFLLRWRWLGPEGPYP